MTVAWATDPVMRNKARLTITLSPDLLEQLDRMIDKETIRNRSHAIEVLLRQGMRPTVTTALILAGGDIKGRRYPALAPINGRPLLSRMIQHLMSFGLSEFLILAGKHETEARDLLGSGEKIGARIRYVREKSPRGTAGALQAASPLLGPDPFLVVHGDVLTDIDISSFVNFHLSENTMATIAVKPRHSERSYGKVILEGNKITDFIERSGTQGISIVNTGVYLFRPAVLNLVDDDKPSRLETDVFPRLARMGELSAFFFQGIWYDTSTPENLRIAESRWQQKG
jgi:NDP-sugar pyrophosphorylase family protein